MFVIRTCTCTFSRFHSPSPYYSTLQITHYRNSFGWFGSQLSFKFKVLVLVPVLVLTITILFLSSYSLFFLRSNLLSLLLFTSHIPVLFHRFHVSSVPPPTPPTLHPILTALPPTQLLILFDMVLVTNPTPSHPQPNPKKNTHRFSFIVLPHYLPSSLNLSLNHDNHSSRSSSSHRSIGRRS